MRTMIEVMKREAPEVEIGNFTRPVRRVAPQAVVQ